MFSVGSDGGAYIPANGNCFNGRMSGWNVFFGPTSYNNYAGIASNQLDQYGIKYGYNVYLKPNYNSSADYINFNGTILSSAYNQNTAVITEEWGLDQLSDGKTLVNGKAYGYGLWTRYLTTYPVRQLTGNNRKVNIIGLMTQNSPYTKGVNYGDRLLLLWMDGNSNAYQYTTYSTLTNKVTISSNIPYPYTTTGLVEGVWVYLYICYQQSSQTMFGFMKSPAGTQMTTQT